MNDNEHHFDDNDVPDVGDDGDLHDPHQEPVKYDPDTQHHHHELPKQEEPHHEETTPFIDEHQHQQEETQQQQVNKTSKRRRDDDDDDDLLLTQSLHEPNDERTETDLGVIKTTVPSTPLELALTEMLKRKDAHIARVTGEIQKLKKFVRKRKQSYKRKRKDEGAPTRALSAYNIFIQDRFKQLSKENEKALQSADSDAVLKRVPPANLVASTGNQWKDLPAEEKAKYEERAKVDRKRYELQMAQYQPPDKVLNRKRNKTGYNMFFSAHVLRLKQTEQGVPSERGSVARIVGNAWKALTQEEKNYYEREADKHNGMNPVKDELDDEDDDEKGQHMHHMEDPYAHMHPHAGYGGMPPDMHQPAHHDPRHHYAPYPHHMYGQSPYGYDYGQHQPQQQQQHHHSSRQSRSHSGYNQGYPPPGRHGYDAM